MARRRLGAAGVAALIGLLTACQDTTSVNVVNHCHEPIEIGLTKGATNEHDWDTLEADDDQSYSFGDSLERVYLARRVDGDVTTETIPVDDLVAAADGSGFDHQLILDGPRCP